MKKSIINFAVSWLETIAVIGFLVFPLVGFLAGLGGGIKIACLGLLVGTLLGILLFGILFLLMQNNQTLKDIRALLEKTQI